MQPTQVCVIGAGPSGLAAAKNCVMAGLPVTVFEKNDRVGGNWVFNSRTGHSSVYENTHIISSRAWSEFEDFPMPADYPDYPGHRQLQAYFESYARHFGVMERIRFGHTVQQVRKTADGGWQVDVLDEQGQAQQHHFTHLMVANGHHWHPKHPEYPGTFTGTYLHSHDFKGVNDDWRDKDVLVIGAGNSACDVAVESARVAGRVAMSMRKPQWFMPKFFFGQPADVIGAGGAWMPRALRAWSSTLLLKIMQGPYARYGLPQPKRHVFSMHPTMNSDLLDFIRHGRIEPRPGIARYDGDHVVFTDGRRERFDIVCACTGFWTVFPFFDRSFIDFQHAEKLPLWRKMMHAEHPTLYFIGLFQPLGCIWPMADMQARLACAEITGRYHRPADLKAAIDHEMAHPHFDFDGGQRHAVEVDYHRFRAELKAELKRAGIDIGAAPQGRERPAAPRPTPALLALQPGPEVGADPMPIAA